MINHRLMEKYSKETCLTDEDLYLYISRQADAERTAWQKAILQNVPHAAGISRT